MHFGARWDASNFRFRTAQSKIENQKWKIIRSVRRRQEVEQQPDDRVEGQQLDAFEPVALPITRDLIRDKSGEHHRGNLRQAEFQVKLMGKKITGEHEG